MKTAILHHGTRFVPHLAQISSLLGWSASALGRTSHPSRYWSPFNSLSLSPLIEKFCWSSMKPSHKKRKTTTSSSKCHQQKDTFSYCQCFLMIYICYPSMNDPKVSSFFSRTTWTSIPPLPPPLFRGWSILLRGQQFWNIGVKGVPFRWGYVVVAAGGKHGGFLGESADWLFFSNLNELFGDICVFCVLLRLFLW